MHWWERRLWWKINTFINIHWSHHQWLSCASNLTCITDTCLCSQLTWSNLNCQVFWMSFHSFRSWLWAGLILNLFLGSIWHRDHFTFCILQYSEWYMAYFLAVKHHNHPPVHPYCEWPLFISVHRLTGNVSDCRGQAATIIGLSSLILFIMTPQSLANNCPVVLLSTLAEE